MTEPLRTIIETLLRERGWQLMEERHPDVIELLGRWWTRPEYDSWWRAPGTQAIRYVEFTEAINLQMMDEERVGA